MAVEYFRRRLKKYLLKIYAKAKKDEVSVKEIKEALRELDINLLKDESKRRNWKNLINKR